MTTKTCLECGMVTLGNQYHPYAACLMFRACRDGSVVRANLDAVIAHGHELGARSIIVEYDTYTDIKRQIAEAQAETEFVGFDEPYADPATAPR